MSNILLIRFGGTAAIVAGVLRAIGSVVPATGSPVTLQILYFFTDLSILFAVLALYLKHHRELGVPGLVGFLLCMLGILIIRSSNLIPGVYLYRAGALIFSVGLNVFGIRLWRARAMPGWIAAFWVTSVLTGIAVSLAPGFPLLAASAGLTFAVGFVGAGLQLRRREPRTIAHASVSR